MGTHMRSISSSMIHRVRMARFSREVNATSIQMFSRSSRTPAACASRCPCSVRSTSVQPVKRFSRFQVLWPWRTRMSFPGTSGSCVYGIIEEQRGEALGGAGAMLKEQRRLGKFEFQDARHRIGVADQIHARIERGGERNGAERPLAGAQ